MYVCISVDGMRRGWYPRLKRCISRRRGKGKERNETKNGICTRKFEDLRLHKRDGNNFFGEIFVGNKDFTTRLDPFYRSLPFVPLLFFHLLLFRGTMQTSCLKLIKLFYLAIVKPGDNYLFKYFFISSVSHFRVPIFDILSS